MKIFALALSIFWTSALFASPGYPWDGNNCTALQQDDGKKIGAVCSNIDSPQNVTVLNVYYFGYLFENRQDYLSFYANLTVDGQFFARQGLKAFTGGDGLSLPQKEVMAGRYVATSNFQQLADFPLGKPFKIYFQAEQKKPTANPPFSFDDNLKKNYSGKIAKIDI